MKKTKNKIVSFFFIKIMNMLKKVVWLMSTIIKFNKRRSTRKSHDLRFNFSSSNRRISMFCFRGQKSELLQCRAMLQQKLSEADLTQAVHKPFNFHNLKMKKKRFEWLNLGFPKLFFLRCTPFPFIPAPILNTNNNKCLNNNKNNK